MNLPPDSTVIPAWYEIAVGDEKTLIIRIHVVAMAYLRTISFAKTSIVEHFTKAHQLKLFIEPSEERWGFSGLLAEIESKDPEWLVYQCTLPVLNDRKKSDLEVHHERSEVYALRSTLATLFQALWIFEGNTQYAKPQLMVIEGLRVVADLYGGAISVTFTPPAARWLAKQPNNSLLTDVEEVMKRAYNYMWQDKKYPPYGSDFRALCRQPKWINISVPGNACGLDPGDYYNESPDQGYTLSPHNADSSLQQLTLLMGLAKLHDLIRQNA